MFSTKKNLVSQLPKKTYVDEIKEAGKKHQVGPLTYKNTDSQHHVVIQKDLHGSFPNGMIKSNVPQHSMIDASKAHAATRP
jgi:hypothetical protein